MTKEAFGYQLEDDLYSAVKDYARTLAIKDEEARRTASFLFHEMKGLNLCGPSGFQYKKALMWDAYVKACESGKLSDEKKKYDHIARTAISELQAAMYKRVCSENNLDARFTEKEPKPDLVFQMYNDDGGAFFTKAEYDRLTQRYVALEKASTWAEFEELLPGGEFMTLSCWDEHGGGYVYKDEDGYQFFESGYLEEFLEKCGDHVISSTDKFDPNVLGVDEGDYPEHNTADELLPLDFVDRYGQLVGGMTSGIWFEYPVNRLKEMKRYLDSFGFSVAEEHSY